MSGLIPKKLRPSVHTAVVVVFTPVIWDFFTVKAAAQVINRSLIQLV